METGQGLPAVYAGEAVYEERAAALAQKLGASLLSEAPGEVLCLVVDQRGLTLQRGDLSLQGDFSRMAQRLRPSNLNGELLVKAARIRDSAGAPTAVDATAGLGEDSLLLAASGFCVTLIEKDPVIAALLADAMARAAKDPLLAGAVGRMRLLEGDSIEILGALTFVPDVVYLDPMFPERQKSGLVKKKFQLLHDLEQPCMDGEALLAAALSAGPRKVVIKRPKKGPYLGGRKPSFSLEGKAIRYDCLLR
ncbi:MAG: class I SAM-dependent methyltransferase [Firmicutes bacterium]|nr:class I SAM-dependent methyltransferase [Bacillota bacterium]